MGSIFGFVTGMTFIIGCFWGEAIGDRIRGSGANKKQVQKILADPVVVEQIAKQLENREESNRVREDLLEEAAMRLLSDDQFASRMFDRVIKK